MSTRRFRANPANIGITGSLFFLLLAALPAAFSGTVSLRSSASRNGDAARTRREQLQLSAISAGAAPQSAPVCPGALFPGDVATLETAGIDAASIRCDSRGSWSGSNIDLQAATWAKDLLTSLPLSEAQKQDEGLNKYTTKFIMFRAIRSLLVDGGLSNFGVVAIAGHKTASGEPLLVYRTSITANPSKAGSCVASLIGAGGARHGVNLYVDTLPTEDLEVAEASAYAAVGGSYFNVRGNQDQTEIARRSESSDEAVLDRASRALAEVIWGGVLRPNGAPPRGHVQVHCAGGMHRTGVTIGVIERCINGEPRELWAKNYKDHVLWKSDTEQGGYREPNLVFIERFNCSLINGAAPPLQAAHGVTPPQTVPAT